MSESLKDNLRKSEEFLKRFKESPLMHYINGKWTTGKSSETFENTTPVDNTSLGQIAKGNVEDMNNACEAAKMAFDEWANMPGQERKKLLHRMADKIEERAEEIAIVESMDTGQAIHFTKPSAARAAANFRFFADKAPEAQNGDALYQQEHTNITMRWPIGPIGIITPWNTPFMLSTWKIAPALASGCTVVHKPAELSPLTAFLLTEMSKEAGIPDGVWNMVNGFGETVGKRLTEHPAIKAVALVGETTTGSHLMRQGADTLKRLHLELGGKNPVIVFNDADFDRALDAVIFMIYSLNGERCTSSSRLLIQTGIQERFIKAVEARAKNLKVGHPLDPATEVGPLIHTSHLEKVLSYVEIARKDGATVAVGGHRLDHLGRGNYFAPTVFTHATNSMRIAREEIFGPALTIIPFTTEKEAIQIANDTEYGLTGYIWTNDVSRAMRMAKQVEAGMLWVNSENNRNLPSPFGGMKKSGIGRDGGDYSFEFYMETKNICIAHGTHKIPVLGR